MGTNEVVSIIISIYNVEAYLRQCLNGNPSDFPNLNLSCHDGSPDQSRRDL